IDRWRARPPATEPTDLRTKPPRHADATRAGGCSGRDRTRYRAGVSATRGRRARLGDLSPAGRLGLRPLRAYRRRAAIRARTGAPDRGTPAWTRGVRRFARRQRLVEPGTGTRARDLISSAARVPPNTRRQSGFMAAPVHPRSPGRAGEMAS